MSYMWGSNLRLLTMWQACAGGTEHTPGVLRGSLWSGRKVLEGRGRRAIRDAFTQACFVEYIILDVDAAAMTERLCLQQFAGEYDEEPADPGSQMVHECEMPESGVNYGLDKGARGPDMVAMAFEDVRTLLGGEEVSWVLEHEGTDSCVSSGPLHASVWEKVLANQRIG